MGKQFPWMMVTLLSPVVGLFREILAMRYLWKEPLKLNNQKLAGVLGREPKTPLPQALETTLKGLKCLADERENTEKEVGGPGLFQPNESVAARAAEAR